tara:strand:- start:1584 stop:2555 length:972 start_codon:yes stop_codon:yes gene_type:complete
MQNHNKKKIFITAEIGLNHNNNFKKTIKLINLAIKAGADAVKFQLFQTKSLWPKSSKEYIYVKKYETNFNFYKKIFFYCKRKKIICYASPFDKFSIDFLKKLNNPIYKWASSEIDKLDNLGNVARTRKKIIISTGMANENDIKKALLRCKNNKNDNIVLMHCVSLYPQPLKYANLNKLNNLKKFGYDIGFSDHSESNISAIVAIAKGATYIEKHITWSKKSKGPDHFYACEINKFKDYVDAIKLANLSLGKSELELDQKIIFATRRKSYHAKRKIYKNEKLKTKDIFLKQNLSGINLNEIKKFIGKKLKKNVLKNKPIKKNYF